MNEFFEKIVSTYNDEIESTCKSYNIRGYDIDDKKQIVYMKIFDALKTNKIDSSNNVAGYIKILSRNAMENLLRDQEKTFNESTNLDLNVNESVSAVDFIEYEHQINYDQYEDLLFDYLLNFVKNSNKKMFYLMKHINKLSTREIIEYYEKYKNKSFSLRYVQKQIALLEKEIDEYAKEINLKKSFKKDK